MMIIMILILINMSIIMIIKKQNYSQAIFYRQMYSQALSIFLYNLQKWIKKNFNKPRVINLQIIHFENYPSWAKETVHF